jgi:hypothetical protein
VNVSPPVPWARVLPGAVVLVDGRPKTVMINAQTPDPLTRGVLLEEGPPFTVLNTDRVPLVVLDLDDAIGNLLRAGFSLEPLTTPLTTLPA